jgi:hypothetical protein
MAKLLEGCPLLHFSQNFGYFFNGMGLKSQANNGAGLSFPGARKRTKCIASQGPGRLYAWPGERMESMGRNTHPTVTSRVRKPVLSYRVAIKRQLFADAGFTVKLQIPL